MTKHADLDLGEKRLVLETSGRILFRHDNAILRTEPKLAMAGTERLTVPLEHISVLAGALGGLAAPFPTDDPPWEGGENVKTIRLYGGENEFIRVKRGPSGSTIERGRDDGQGFHRTAAVHVPANIAALLGGALQEE